MQALQSVSVHGKIISSQINQNVCIFINIRYWNIWVAVTNLAMVYIVSFHLPPILDHKCTFVAFHCYQTHIERLNGNRAQMSINLKRIFMTWNFPTLAIKRSSKNLEGLNPYVYLPFPSRSILASCWSLAIQLKVNILPEFGCKIGTGANTQLWFHGQSLCLKQSPELVI